MHKRQHIILLSTLSAAVILTAGINPALAQSADEPYYEQVVEIHLQPPPPRTRSSRQHHDAEQPCRSCAVAVVHRPAPRRLAPVNSGPFISLDANVGYGGYYWIFGESVSGPVFSGSLTMLWGVGHSKGGLRLTGFYSLSEGEVDRFLDDGSNNDPAKSQLAGGSASVIGRYKGLWGSAGLGVLHVQTDSIRYNSDYDAAPYNNSDDYTLPELCMGAGYNLQLSKNFALRFSGEVGTFFFLSWRASINGGVMLRF